MNEDVLKELADLSVQIDIIKTKLDDLISSDPDAIKIFEKRKREILIKNAVGSLHFEEGPSDE